MASPRVLLTVSGSIPDDLDADIATGARPRADYRALQSALGADVLDTHEALRRHRRIGRLIRRVAGDHGLIAWAMFRARRDVDVVFSDGEQVGLPYGLLCRLAPMRTRPLHLMIVHIMTTPTKRRLVRWARLAPMIDHWFVYCTAQETAIAREFAVPPERITLTTFMVDSSFFSPAAATERPSESRRRLISAAGLERRDYATLIEAVRDLDVDVVIAAASPWSRQSDSSQDAALPGNVTVSAYSQFDLRDLYARSALVVMPLVEVDFQAGITAILEAMSMERVVVCSRTAGQTDTIVDGRTGVYVPPGDAVALRRAIESQLDDPDGTVAIGRAARRWVRSEADIDVYADRLAGVVRRLAVAERAGTGGSSAAE